MDNQELKTVYKEYFQYKIKQSPKYKSMFGEAVDYQKKYLETVSKEDRIKIEKMVENFINAENQMLEDTFVYSFKYAYIVFNELHS